MQINHPSGAPSLYELVGDIRSGRGGGATEPVKATDRAPRVLLSGEEGSPANFRFAYSVAGPEKPVGDDKGWETPRHHHNFEQIRLPLAGDYSIGQDKVLPAGWVGYFPESAWYGPQVMSPNLTMLVLQFGGPSGNGYLGLNEWREAFDKLAVSENGSFQKGMYTWNDENGKRHNEDAFEALWRESRGERVHYPEPRYDSTILMNPENFSWIDDPTTPGVARKHLGTFTEREVRVGFIKLDPGATLQFGKEPAAEIAFVRSGAVRHDGIEHPEHTAFGSGAKDEPEEITATSLTELFYVKLPTF